MANVPCPHCDDAHPAGTYACPRTQRRISGLLANGTLIDSKFRILGVIGSGGMGVVYRAENVKISRQVAVKMLLPEYTAYPELVARVEREAKTAGGIDHPNVVTIVDLGTTPVHGPYIAMELLRGEELATRIEKSGGKLGVQESVEIARQVLAALQCAHEHGVVHRDLKPENVFLTLGEGGRSLVKVLDFGISKVAADKPGLSSLTRTGMVVGTPQFMAPEQAAGTKQQDARVDVYAAGVLLYAMLTGQLPYEAENYNLLINDILNKPPVHILARDPAIDPDLAEIVMRTLARDPNERPPTASLLAEMLASWTVARTTPGIAAPSAGTSAVATAPYGPVRSATGASRQAPPPAPLGRKQGADSTQPIELSRNAPDAIANVAVPRPNVAADPAPATAGGDTEHEIDVDDDPTEAVFTVPEQHSEATPTVDVESPPRTSAPDTDPGSPSATTSRLAPVVAAAPPAVASLAGATPPPAADTSRSIKLPTPLEWEHTPHGTRNPGARRRRRLLGWTAATLGTLAVVTIVIRVAAPDTWHRLLGGADSTSRSASAPAAPAAPDPPGHRRSTPARESTPTTPSTAPSTAGGQPPATPHVLRSTPQRRRPPSRRPPPARTTHAPGTATHPIGPARPGTAAHPIRTAPTAVRRPPPARR